MLWYELARAVGEQGGGAVYAKRACLPPTERNGTFSFEPAVVSVGTGRKCAFGATIGICAKFDGHSRINAQSRSKRDLVHSRATGGALGLAGRARRWQRDASLAGRGGRARPERGRAGCQRGRARGVTEACQSQK